MEYTNYEILCTTNNQFEDITTEEINTWLENDMLTKLTINLPITGKIRTHEKPTNAIVQSKLTMTQYPIVARPTLERTAYKELDTLANRLYNRITFREITIPLS